MEFEDQKFKPTLPIKKATDMGKNHEKEMTKSIVRNGLPPTHLTEVDVNLNEKQESFKKKIWDLAKMEALVHSDERLSALYNNMAEEGEDKYGYHYNETIMNIIFNEYVMNDSRFLQKYYMAVPVEKKRRDKSGINQLQKQGSQKTGVDKARSQLEKQRGINKEGEIHNNSLEGVIEEDPIDSYQGGDSGTFDDREYMTHAINKQYDTMDNVQEHHLGTREEKIDFILTHKGDTYPMERLQTAPDEQIEDIYNAIEQEMLGVEETTGAASSGSFAAPMAISRKGFAEGEEEEEVIDETTTSASSGQFTTKLGTDGHSGKGGRDPKLDKPAWEGGEIIGESDYLTDPSGFAKYLNEMEEIKEDINDYPLPDELYNQPSMTQGLDMTKVPTEMLKRVQQELAANSKKYGNTANNMKLMQMIQKFLGIGEGLGEDYEMVSMDDIKKTIPKQYQDNLDEPLPVNNAMKQPDEIDEKAKSKNQQQFMGMVHAAQKGELEDPSPAVEKAADSISYDDAEDFASTKHKGLPEKVPADEGAGETLGKIGGAIAGGAIGKSPSAAITGSKIGGAIGSKFDVNEDNNSGIVQYHSERAGEDPFEMNQNKWQFVNAIYPDGKRDIGVYRFGHDLVYDYQWWREQMGIDKPANESIANGREDDPTTMAATMKDVPAGGGGGSDMGFGGLGEAQKEVKVDDNNPLKDFGNSMSGVGGHDVSSKAIDHNHEPIEPKTMDNMREAVETRTKCDSDEERVAGKSVHEKGGCKKKKGAGEQTIMKSPKGDELSDRAKNPSNVKSRIKRMSKYEKDLESKKGEYSQELEKHKQDMDKLKGKKKSVTEDKKHSSMVNVERIGKDNKENFNKDLADSNTEMLKVKQDELTAQDQITQVPENPYEMAQDIEKQHLANTHGGKGFGNVGDSTNDVGDEIPKRNITSEEEEMLNLYRKGQHSWNYDSEPSKRFMERMKKDMGEEAFELMKKQMEYIAGAPMYNKDTQPTEGAAVDKTQFDKYKSGWNEKKGLKMEGVMSAKYKDEFGKNVFMNFNVNEAEEVENVDGLTPLNLDGMGNSYTTRVHENKNMREMMDAYKFYINGQNKIKYAKTGKQTLSENTEKGIQVVNEEFAHMKKLMGYDPSIHIDTSNVKKNRGF